MMAQAVSVEPESGLLQRRTIGRLWLDAVNANRRSPAYLVERDGAWEEVSWQEAARAVDELAQGLIAAGIGKGDAFAILGQTTLEWALFDFALGLVGAIGVPIYANSSAKDAQFVLVHSEALGILCEDEEQRA
jgi:long-chain acyl-CoA synthetase